MKITNKQANRIRPVLGRLRQDTRSDNRQGYPASVRAGRAMQQFPISTQKQAKPRESLGH